uniref:PHD finger protein 13 n=1 Tax=Sphenodon punctatus TaxID=8508 RepID=A0A8D0HT68_SPHPU
MKLKDSLFDLDPASKQPPPLPPQSLGGARAGADKKKDKRNRKPPPEAAAVGGGAAKRSRVADPAGEKRSRIKKSKKRKLKKADRAEKKLKTSLSDTDSEEDEALPLGAGLVEEEEGGAATAPLISSSEAPPELLGDSFPAKLEEAEGKGCISTETSQDGDGSSSEGEMRVMDEDIMVESGDDSWDLITCYCQKPFAGRPMIECNQCGTWIHLSCAKIKKTNVPDIFYCQKCKDGSRKPLPPPAATTPRGGGEP